MAFWYIMTFTFYVADSVDIANWMWRCYQIQNLIVFQVFLYALSVSGWKIASSAEFNNYFAYFAFQAYAALMIAFNITGAKKHAENALNLDASGASTTTNQEDTNTDNSNSSSGVSNSGNNNNTGGGSNDGGDTGGDDGPIFVNFNGEHYARLDFEF